MTLSLPPQVRVFLHMPAYRHAKGIDGLHGLVLEVLQQKPQSGGYVFSIAAGIG